MFWVIRGLLYRRGTRIARSNTSLLQQPSVDNADGLEDYQFPGAKMTLQPAVPDLRPGDTDSIGATVRAVLAKEPGKYIIYETEERSVSVDGPDTSACHRPGIHKAMMEIADLTIHDPSLKARYNSRIGHAYKIALDGDGDSCETALEGIAEDMAHHLRRPRQRAYQMGALLGVTFASLLYYVVSRVTVLNDLAIRLFCGAVFASVGGFLSVLIGSREIELDLKESFSATLTYGMLRITIAAISGVIVVFLIGAGLVLGPLKNPDSFNAFALVCIVAGFSERLIPNVLKSLESSTRLRK
jgi:hypothetical protein